MIYQTTVIGIGDQVHAFDSEGIFVTFGENAPDTLKDFCYSVEIKEVHGTVRPGNKLVIDGEEFTVTQVGSVAQDNLKNLGHVTYSFTERQECLPGSICLEQGSIPGIKVGTVISIIE